MTEALADMPSLEDAKWQFSADDTFESCYRNNFFSMYSNFAFSSVRPIEYQSKYGICNNTQSTQLTNLEKNTKIKITLREKIWATCTIKEI